MMFRNWFTRRREANRQKLFERGFGYVMTAYHLHKQPSYYLWDAVSEGAAFDSSPFDEGAYAALRLLPDDQP